VRPATPSQGGPIAALLSGGMWPLRPRAHVALPQADAQLNRPAPAPPCTDRLLDVAPGGVHSTGSPVNAILRYLAV